jgi:cytochrome c oxidase cbb3-type subunit III
MQGIRGALRMRLDSKRGRTGIAGLQRGRVRIFVGLWLGLASAAPLVYSQQHDRRTHEPQSSAEGQQIFAANCAACHGLDGSGTQRAPNIRGGSKIQQLPEAEILRIVSEGIPGTGMPSFRHLGATKMDAVVTYVETLQGGSHLAPLPGNPAHGKKLFFGDAGCSTCHTIAGTGGFIAPDLTVYAQNHSPERIEAAIRDRAQRDSKLAVVSLTTTDGQAYRGIVRNEDNFSVQLQSMDGGFHFFRKTDLKRIEREPGSMMPSDYGSKLTRTQLDDLISFLFSVSNESRSAAPAKEKDED